MRTTLDIADDVLQAAKELGRRQKKTAGQVISELARKALVGLGEDAADEEPVLGFKPFPSRGNVVTDQQIDELREDGPY